MAAVVVAAECWAREGDAIDGRLARDIQFQRDAEGDRRREMFVAEVVPMVRAMRGHPAQYAGQQVRPLEDIGAEHIRRASAS